MRIVAISDTHGLHEKVKNLPEGDVLVHAGDFMNAGVHLREIISFNHWLGEQKQFKHRVVCAGNHDKYFEAEPGTARNLLENATYLENSGITLDGVRFWASPYTPEFYDWAFMYSRGTAAAKYWKQIPDRLDVLITHGPPLGILDQVAPGAEHLGCSELLDAIQIKKPKVHLFGHIHGGAGTVEKDGVRFVNAAFLNEAYKAELPAGSIRVIDL
jgi:Icc-related predicted phosphoesterase